MLKTVYQSNMEHLRRGVEHDIIEVDEWESFGGIGKPEPLKGDMSGFWSRRIDDVNRLVYRISGNVIEIVSCKGHYENWV